LLVLLGLPGLYAAHRGGMGPLGLVGFLTAFSGTYLIAVTGNFGFLPPVLAKQSPLVLDSINQYPPVVIINGLAAILFMIGFILFGIAMIRTAALPRWSGLLVAVGRSGASAGFRDSSACLDCRLGDRVSRRWARLGELSALADTDRGDRNRTSGRHGVAVGCLRRHGDPLPMMSLFDKQIQLRMGQANMKRWIPDIMPSLTDEDPLGVDDLATHRLPLAEAAAAYGMFQRKADGAVKIMLKPWG
jgi:hypothetical protein